MQIVIPLIKEDTTTNYGELRYALRSFVKFMPHDGVTIIGGLPNWINPKKVTHIPFTDDKQPKYREANIYLKIRYFIEKDKTGPEFIFANDDHFLLTHWNPLPPYPHKGSLRASLVMRSDLDPYRKTIGNTIRLLGDGALNLDVHAPMAMDPELFLRIFGKDAKDRNHAIQWGNTPYGYLFKSLYGQMHASYLSPDIKINEPITGGTGIHDTLVRLTDDIEFFSISDRAFNIEMAELLQILYPTKSEYELY